MWGVGGETAGAGGWGREREEEGPRGRGGGGAEAGAGGLPEESHSAAAARAASGDGPCRGDLTWTSGAPGGPGGGREEAPGSAGRPGPGGAEQRSWDTGGAAAAPDGTSALGPLVQAGASGEAFTGRFTRAFPYRPAQASLRSLPAHGPSPSAVRAPSHLTPWSSFSPLSALLAPSAVR